jgi:5-methyltetrahydropteroyltriglutamate--homocysteine methyltransferase
MAARERRILTTHVGSLVRPPALLRYITAMEDGVAIDEKAYQACLKASVAEVVKHQAKAGIDFVSDGEFGKPRSWSFYAMDRLTGFEERDLDMARGLGRDATLFPEFYAEYFPTQQLPRRGAAVAVGPIRYTGKAAIKRDIDNFKSALRGRQVVGGFLPVVAPASAVPRFKDEYYGSEEKFLFALAEAMHEEYAAIVRAGLFVQIDDAFLPYMYDMGFGAKHMKKYRKWATLRIEALNHALRGIPEEKVRYHICWGSFNTPHVSDVPLKDIVDLVLKVNAGYYLIEMANPRHEHEWHVFEKAKLPDGKVLVPGVISHATNVVEHPELVAERLVRLAKLVGRENVMGGTDCGFAQAPHVKRVHESIQWAKLEALAEGARIATKQLWGRKAG